MSGITRIAQGLVVLAAVFVSLAGARASDAWTVVQAVGEVQIAPPGAPPAGAKAAMPVPDGSTVRTGDTGRAVLLRGRETIVMSPSSVLTLPSGAARDISKVRQKSGTLLFKVGKKPDAHFEVDTPYLAAVVKGTTFTVKVSAAGATVHVLEGAVEVATTDRKNVFLTRAGQISSVFAQAANEIFTTGAALLNSSADSGDVWGPSQSRFEMLEPSQDALSANETHIVGETGLRGSRRSAGDQGKDQELTARAPERLISAFRAVEDTLGASRARTTKTKLGKGDVHATAGENRNIADSNAGADRRSANRERAQSSDTGQDRAPSAPNGASVWSVTQAKGDITVDGAAYANFGDGRVRSLPPGTKVVTGPNSHIGLAAGAIEYVVEANSVVILGDPSDGAPPNVVAGNVTPYPQETEGNESGRSQSADTGRAPDGKWGAKASGANPAPVFQATRAPASPPPQTSHKTQEVRTKVLGGLTLGLYALTAVLVLMFCARWMWNRYRTKSKEPRVETPVQARVRSIKEA